MPTLVLALEGPFQAWGSGSKFDNRQTEDIPTKSGIIGMIGAALGRKRGENLDDLNELLMTVRVDQPGERLNDLQILQIKGNDPYLSRKYYLADAKFLVCIEHSDLEFLRKIENALNHPFYPISLGRRNCIPAGNLVRGIKNTNGEDTARSYPWLASNWYQKKYKNRNLPLKLFTEGSKGFRQVRLKDAPVSFDRNNRLYKTRIYSEITPVVFSSEENEKGIDFFKEVSDVSEQN